MPRQDAQGRWYSDDGAFYWDGVTWRAVGAQASATRKPSMLAPILIGAGFTAVVVLVLGLVLLVLVFTNPYMQRSFCNGWYSGQNNSENLACPLHPPSP